MTVPRPDTCAHDPTQCQISVTTAVREPLIEWAPVYDGTGAQINRDPNVHLLKYACAFCGMRWELESTAPAPAPPHMDQGE